MPQDLAEPAARALVAAERDGLASHGLARVPFYAAQMRTGKVVADGRPRVERDGAVIRGSMRATASPSPPSRRAPRRRARCGRARPCRVSIGHSHHFGVAGRRWSPSRARG
jgi:(2R)-3-sulfolactate dehydrogenase (NADP+)